MKMIRKSIVVVGSGLAGMCCALELSKCGMDCLILDKYGLGGSIRNLNNGIAAIYPSKDYERDSIDLFKSDIIKSGEGLCKPDLVNKLVNDSFSAVSFLEEIGIEMLPDSTRFSGHSVPRIRFARTGDSPSFGEMLHERLVDQIEQSEYVDVLVDSPVIDIDRNQDGEFELTINTDKNDDFESEITLLCDNLVVATGGFCKEIYERFLDGEKIPETPTSMVEGFPFSSVMSPGSGEIMRKIQDRFGANIIQDMSAQLHPMGLQATSDGNEEEDVVFLAPEVLLGNGAIIVDGIGKRFVDEIVDTRKRISNQTLIHGSIWGGNRENYAISRLLFDTEVLEKSELSELETKVLVSNMIRFGNALEFSEYEEMEYDHLVGPAFPFDEEKPLFMVFITPAIHYSLGGLEIDKIARVLDEDEKVIGQLYAVGECTGGVHGANLLAGNSVLDSIVFGRAAAAHIIYEKMVNIMELARTVEPSMKQKY